MCRSGYPALDDGPAGVHDRHGARVRRGVGGPARGEEGVSLDIGIVEATDDARVLGGIGLVRIDWIHERADIGYWTAPAQRGRGVTTRAVRLLSNWALTELGLKRLELGLFAGNDASERVAQSTGFTREGVLRSAMNAKHGRVDVVLYSLLRT